MPRTNFTDLQRAEIFVLDRATCSFSGRNLWIPDYGIDPAYQVDWADHVIPASRGGKSTIENGASASWLYNYLSGSNLQKVELFRRGLPTSHHTMHVGVLDKALVRRIHKFRHLHISDWFLNRAMWHIGIAVAFEYERRQGYKRSRDYDYYARASFTSLEKWRRLVERDSVSSLEQRGLLPDRPESDQTQMLLIRTASSSVSIKRYMKDLFPIYESAARCISSVSEAINKDQIEIALGLIRSEDMIPPRIQSRLIAYSVALKRLLPV